MWIESECVSVFRGHLWLSAKPGLAVHVFASTLLSSSLHLWLVIFLLPNPQFFSS
eukprot:m.75621 g.75621  ORF g.75621 m.75621 type:complete len:55 (-) comp12454_c0_seq2:210-374(-)